MVLGRILVAYTELINRSSTNNVTKELKQLRATVHNETAHYEGKGAHFINIWNVL